jgi:hypothetical protein
MFNKTKEDKDHLEILFHGLCKNNFKTTISLNFVEQESYASPLILKLRKWVMAQKP